MVSVTNFQDQYSAARMKYKPKRIRILMIAESPPASGGFFYFERTIGKDHLFRETMKALSLWPKSQPMPKGIDKRPLLNRFQSGGFFLVDTSLLPINSMPMKQRRMAVLAEIPRLVADVCDLKPDKILIVKSTIFRPVKEALERSGMDNKILNKEPLPFPSHGNQGTFRRTFRRLLRTFQPLNKGTTY